MPPPERRATHRSARRTGPEDSSGGAFEREEDDERPGPRVLLLDCLDAIGSDLADARDRVSLLRAGGARVVALAVGTHLDPSAKGLGRGALVASPGAEALEAARRLAGSARYDVAIVASAESGGGSIVRALPSSLPARWWPTGMAGAVPGGWVGRLKRSFGSRELTSVLPLLSRETPRPVPPLAGCCVEAPGARRATLPLWDGDIVLVPEGFGHPGGSTALSAFASVAEEWSELDLVTWSHPREGDEAMARRFGVAARVHHVGPAPRMAEWAWWSQARAVVWTGRSPIAGGLVLRALAAGCPLLFVGEARPMVSVARSLREEGCAWCVPEDPAAVAAELSRLLDHGPDVAAAVERGRIVAAHHDRSALAGRLASALSLRPPRDAAAAA